MKSRYTGESEFEQIPEGSYQAVLFKIWDLGLVVSEKYGNASYKVAFRFELNKRMENNKRYTLTVVLTDSFGLKANMPKFLKGWGVDLSKEVIKAGFDYSSLIGRNGIATVTHTESGEKVYANITAIVPLLDGMQPITAETVENEMPRYLKSKSDSASGDNQPAIKAATQEYRNPVSQLKETFGGRELESDSQIPF